MLRQLKHVNMQGNIYVLAVLAFIGFLYYTGVYLIWFKRMPLSSGSYIYIAVIHIFTLLFLWSYFTCILSDPGQVPLYWGFFLDDPEHKKRRYCLVCHIFKPQRCHHCSTCNRCVLNMDHHCPWLNNCIGFYNRKFFILMLAYCILTVFFLNLGMIRGIIYLIDEQFLKIPVTDHHFQQNLDFLQNKYIEDCLILIGYGCNTSFLIVISIFFNFHLDLLLTNSTTIENLDKSRQKTNLVQSVSYDMGQYYNWVQIMGKNPWLWMFPVFMNTGKPVGDGVLWPQKQQYQQFN